MYIVLFWLVLQGDTFEVAASLQAKNERTGQSCYVSSFEFMEHYSIFGDEVHAFKPFPRVMHNTAWCGRKISVSTPSSKAVIIIKLLLQF